MSTFLDEVLRKFRNMTLDKKNTGPLNHSMGIYGTFHLLVIQV